jgi:phosphate transport system substrate-binding protein
MTRIPLGLDGVTMVVHATNDAPNLTLSQLQSLYTGDLLDWDEVGGATEPILLVSREDGSGTRIAFESRVMGDESVSLTAVMMPTSWDVIEFVSGQPQAIGYVSRAYVQELLISDEAESDGEDVETRSGSIRVLPVDETLPDAQNLADRSYPLVQPLFLVSRNEPRGWVREFVNFALSPAGQEIVGHYHLPVR